MPTCDAQTYVGSNVKCGRGADALPYFWFRDSSGAFSQEFKACFPHSQKLLNTLIFKEQTYSRTVDSLYSKIKKLKLEQQRGSNVAEERQKITDARKQGLAIPKFKKMEEFNKEISDIYEKITKFKGFKNHERNKVCRFCGWDLTEPEFKEDQTSGSYSHTDWHSDKGYRREVIMMHTRCGRQWLFNNIVVDEKVRLMLLPRSRKQFTLEQSLE